MRSAGLLGLGATGAGSALHFTSLDNANIQYYLESTTNLMPPANWLTMTSASGLGPGLQLRDATPGDAQKFYWIRVQ